MISFAIPEQDARMMLMSVPSVVIASRLIR